MQIKACYIDESGKHADKYTVYFNVKFNRSGSLYECLGMSEHPTHPQGVSMFGGGQLGPHNGKKVNFEELPKHIQEHVNYRIKE
jgi:hypothetical protein